MTPANLNHEWADLLLDTLARCGAGDAVISPGSRSTPLAWAAIRCDRLRTHRIVDERSAAFFAVGRAKMTGKPAILICTSGTAGAHYYPAVIEASRSCVPLIVVTADRPPELQGCGAAQTIDQEVLYGSHARAYIELGVPEPGGTALRGVRSKAERAFGAALFPTPGPVQVNAPFRKPLEPAEAKSEEERRLVERAGAVRRRPVPPVSRPVNDGPGAESAIDELVRICGGKGAPLIACGPVSPADRGDHMAVVRQLDALPFPVFAEATSQLRFASRERRESFCDGFDTFLRSPAAARRDPAAIIRLGAPLTSKGWELFAAEAEAPVFIVAPHHWEDPHNRGARFVRCTAEFFVQKFYSRFSKLDLSNMRGELSRYRSASAATVAALEQIVPAENEPLTPGSAARALVSNLPPRSLLALSNSLPVRDIDMFTAGCEADLLVWCQRGVNGIDGLISGAAGAASALPPGRAATLYVGDVAFLHDLGGLAAAREATVPLAIVVAANRGGRIFEQLPIARHPEMDEASFAWWTTPSGLNLEKAAALFDIRYERAETAGRLAAAVRMAHDSDGCTIIEAVIDPATIMAEQDRLRERAARALEKPE